MTTRHPTSAHPGRHRFEEIEIGERATLARTLTREVIELFAVMSGDVNPLHVDEEYAHSDMFHTIIAHGMWGASLISTLLGTKLPGAGTLYLSQTLRFCRPVTIGDTVTVSVDALEKESEDHRIWFGCCCVNQRGEVVIDGRAEATQPAFNALNAPADLGPMPADLAPRAIALGNAI